MNRGVGKRPLFEDRPDARFFMARLAQQVRLGRIEVHAFCLMITHYHLLVRSPVGELGESMQRVQCEHSRQFNRRRERDGTLVRGRYTSKPVRSMHYRRTLVRYIDANPVKAGIVRRAGDFELGSARSYMGAPSPRWLNRTWIELDSCTRSSLESYSPRAYRLTFGDALSPESEQLISARIASRAMDDPLDNLIKATPEGVQQWLKKRASLADGCSIGLPVCSPLALSKAIDSDLRTRGPWQLRIDNRTKDAVELCRTGFMRDLCGQSLKAICLAHNRSMMTIRRQIQQHRKLIRSNTDYGLRAATLGQSAMARCV